MANPLTASSLKLANYTGKDVWKKNINSGVISKLAPSVEFMYGSTDLYTFTGTPKAELVAESGQKGSAEAAFNKVTATTHKVQLTYRFSDELKRASEDRQLAIVDTLVGNILVSLNRAVDLMAIHGINPATGTVAPSITSYLNKKSNGVAHILTAGDANDDLNKAAAALQANGYVADGIAFDPAFAGELARSVDADGRKLYPELGFGFKFDSFQGLKAVGSDTISGRNEISTFPENKMIQGIMGDWSALRWGIAGEIPLELIETGDPDGQGDLKRLNQVAIRAEAYIGFAVMDGKAFAVVEKNTAA